jgi:hypothetical protein
MEVLQVKGEGGFLRGLGDISKPKIFNSTDCEWIIRGLRRMSLALYQRQVGNMSANSAPLSVISCASSIKGNRSVPTNWSGPYPLLFVVSRGECPVATGDRCHPHWR